MSETKEEPKAYNLFEDSVLTSARDRLTPEQLEKYALAGEQMYNYDFEAQGEGPERDLDTVMKNAAAEIVFLIRNGFHPSYLGESERTILNQSRGKEWYLRFGYTKEDLDSIVTVPADLPIQEKLV
tara:strand:+ start:203 stop:580 length:378 start_codon:yes stop_codon:yes gene_type:complete